MTASALEARSLHRFFRYGDEETLALQGVTVDLGAGEMVAVIGPSGSGKSTLLACLAGLDEPDGGTVTVVGHRLSHRDECERTRLRARHIGVLLQASNLVEHLTVLQNVILVQRLVGFAVHPDPGALLADLGLADRASAYPSRLSGGEAARAGLAVALANDPAVVLADEPTGELDGVAEAWVLDMLAAATGRGVGVLIASHARAVAAAADRTVTLVDGRVAA